MFKNIDMKRLFKILLMISAVLFMLTACSKDGAITCDDGDEECIRQLAEKQRDCWQSSILNLLYDTMGKVAMGMYTKTTEGAMNLMMVAFGIWFALRLLKFVSSVEPENSGEVWNEVLRQFIVCWFCGILASSTTGVLYVLNMFIFPIFNAFLEFASEILNTASSSTSATASFELFGATYAPTATLTCSPGAQDGVSLDGFPESSRNMMSCMICALSDRLNIGFMLSFKVMAAPGVMPIIIGFVILCCFTFIKLGFVFYLVDTIFKFTMMVVLLPILIMGYAFKKTRKWTTEGMKIMLTAAAFMMAIAIMITMTLLAIVEVLQNKAIFGDGEDWVFREFSPAVFCLLMIAFLIVSSISVAAQISSTIAGSKPDTKFQKKVAAVGAMVLSIVTAGAGAALMKIQKVRQMKAKYDKIKAGAGKFQGKLNSLAGRSGGKKSDDEEGQDGQ